MENLESCPFCRADAKVHTCQVGMSTGGSWVECSKCEARSGIFDDYHGIHEELAAEAWNTRAESAGLLTLQDQNQTLLTQVEYLTENNVRLNNLLKIAVEQNADQQDRYNEMEKLLNKTQKVLQAVSNDLTWQEDDERNELIEKRVCIILKRIEALTQLNTKEA